MKIIVITPPEFTVGEAGIIARLQEHGVWAVHLRKPQSSAAEMARLITAVPAWCRPKLVLHDHFCLCATYGLKGVHLNRRNPVAPPDHQGSCSCSVHGVDELRTALPMTDYAFLSPVYDSISKEGYRSAYTPARLEEAHTEGSIGPQVFALGGVTLERLPEVEKWGFGGAALLGDVWQRVRQPGFEDYLRQLETWTRK